MCNGFACFRLFSPVFSTVLQVSPVFAGGGPVLTCADMKGLYSDAACCGADMDKSTGYQVVPASAVCMTPGVAGTKLGVSSSWNKCSGKKPTAGGAFDNSACFIDSVIEAVEQSGTNVTVSYEGDRNHSANPTMTSYFKAGLCPVNVHWHWGSEHLSVGQYDVLEDVDHDNGPAGAASVDTLGGLRRGYRCNLYDKTNEKFDNSKYEWKHCKDMKVGETYEVHWPHSALGACGTPNQYQTPFYDGVLCSMEDPDTQLGSVDADTLARAVGVQAQVFTIINDEDYYYPNLFLGAIDSASNGGHMWKEVTYYTGSTTGTSRNNEVCSKYGPITWQVDRTCHLISASSFDKMCADMKQQRDDMSDDLHAHGSRVLVADSLSADNHVFKVRQGTTSTDATEQVIHGQ